MPQVIVEPTKTVHAVAFVPSQARDVQTFFGSDWAQGERVPVGGPMTVTQAPMLVAVLQAWHWPLHAVVQQTPSTHVAPVGQTA